MRLVVLTGGVSTGKSTSAKLFRKHKIPVIVFDEIVDKVISPSSPAYQHILKHFGGNVMKSDGSVDRRLLNEVTWHDPNKKKLFDDIIRPYASKQIFLEVLFKWITYNSTIIIDISIFFEDILPHWLFNDIITVSCNESTQIMRMTVNSGFTKEEAVQRIHSQIPLEFKKAMSSIVIDNDGSFEELEEQIVGTIKKWEKQPTSYYKYPSPFVALLMILVVVFIILSI